PLRLAVKPLFSHRVQPGAQHGYVLLTLRFSLLQGSDDLSSTRDMRRMRISLREKNDAACAASKNANRGESLTAARTKPLVSVLRTAYDDHRLRFWRSR